MNNIVDALFNICHLEELARRKTKLNKLHPLSKLIVTFLLIISVTAVNKYEMDSLLLYASYPLLMILVGDIPFTVLGKKMIVPILFATSFGLLNPILDSSVVRVSETLVVSAGWLSLGTLLVKSVLIISSTFILVATTPIEDIAYGLGCLKMPKIITIQLLLVFRYITILIDEVDRTLMAYSLRSGGQKSIRHEAWGSLIGQLFLRASKRSIGLYEAMQLRGFNGEFNRKRYTLKIEDVVYMIVWLVGLGVLIGMRQ